MKILKAVIMLLVLCGSMAKAQEKNEIIMNMITSNAIDDSLPFGVVNGTPFKPQSEAMFVKIHLFPDTPFDGLQSIKVTSCENSFGDGIDAYVNFDEVMSKYVVGTYNYSPNSKKVEDHKAAVIAVGFAGLVNSVTLNFNTSTEICISSIEFFDIHSKKYLVKTPQIIEGTVTADSILSPKDSYDPFQLFDSRFETGWATDGKKSGSSLNFDFKEERTITKIKVWNGYQRSLSHCQANSRPKKMKAKMESGEVEFELTDVLGGQVANLAKPLKGKHLILTALESFEGKKYPDMVISEIRFFDGKDWFMINPLPQIQALHKKMKSEFSKANLQHILNRDLAAATDGGSHSNLRLRSDGTFFYSGNYQDGPHAFNISALGSYELKSAGKDGARVRMFGYYKKQESEFGGDCNGCGFKCNSPKDSEKDPRKIFQEEISINAGADEKTVEIKSLDKKSKIRFVKKGYEVR